MTTTLHELAAILAGTPLPPRAPCGTRMGFRHHRSEGTEPCAECVNAQREYHAEWRAKRRAERDAA